MSAASKINMIYIAAMILAAFSAYLIPTCDEMSSRKEAASKLQKIQSFKMKDNISLKERVERLLPGGQWNGTIYYASYSIGSKILYWEVEGDRVLASSGFTIKLFPDLSPRVDKDLFDSYAENQPFDPFVFERVHTVRSAK